MLPHPVKLEKLLIIIFVVTRQHPGWGNLHTKSSPNIRRPNEGVN